MTPRSVENFAKPFLDQILFEAKFPNLFYIENKIGDFQMEIIEKLPESALLYRQQLLFTDMGPKIKEEVVSDLDEKSFRKKIWQFKSTDIEVNVTSNSIDISTNKLKDYDVETTGFKPIIEFIISKFLKIMAIPQFSRIGLRYINIIPLEQKTNTYFKSIFNTVFPISRFKIEDSKHMAFMSKQLEDDKTLIFQEALREIGGKMKLILDLDCYSTNIKSVDHLSTTDQLHKIIKREFFSSIKEPLKAMMRA